MTSGRGDAGQSLVEVTVLLLVAAIAAIGLAATIPVATQNQGGARAAHARALAEAKVSELENARGGPALEAGTRADTPGGGYVREWTVSPDDPEPGMTTISVDVRWRDAAGERHVALSGSLPGGRGGGG